MIKNCDYFWRIYSMSNNENSRTYLYLVVEGWCGIPHSLYKLSWEVTNKFYNFCINFQFLFQRLFLNHKDNFLPFDSYHPFRNFVYVGIRTKARFQIFIQIINVSNCMNSNILNVANVFFVQFFKYFKCFEYLMNVFEMFQKLEMFFECFMF